jgi:hypothetical protein
MSSCIRVVRAQAGWTLTDTSHKDAEQSTIGAYITLDGVTLTDSLIRLSPNEWPSVYMYIYVRLDYSNYTWRRVQLMKFLII